MVSPRTPTRGSNAMTLGPTTPTKNQSTATSAIDVDYYNGVPGAPDRKLRSHTIKQDQMPSERQSKIKSVAKLIDFGKAEGKDHRKTNATKSKSDHSARSDPSTSTAPPSLGSPFRYKEKGSTEQRASPAMKRSYSTTTTEADLVGFHPDHLLKRSRRAGPTPEMARRSLHSHQDTEMRRSMSASLKDQAISSITSRPRSKTLSSRIHTIKTTSQHPYDPFLTPSETSKFNQGGFTLTRSNSNLSRRSSSASSPWEEGVHSVRSSPRLSSLRHLHSPLLGGRSGDYFGDWPRQSIHHLAQAS